MRPTIRQLEYLVAVADALNFREAARQCHVTQPALSTQIAQLEELLGIRLFERDRRHVLLTPAGAATVKHARGLLTASDDLVEGARALGKPLTGNLRLGIIPTVAPYVLPRALPTLRKRFPDLRLLLREDQTARLVALLAEGRLDLLLLALEADLGDVHSVPLVRDPFHVAFARDHRLAAREQLRDKDLTGETVLLLEDGHCLREQALEVCQTAGAIELGDFRATSLSTLAHMASAGAGITLLPTLCLPTETRIRGLAVRPFARPAPFRTIGLAWRKTSPREGEFLMLADLLRPLLEEAEKDGK
jgi:LysR family hydrogen peroxide-inducible transcriptional activator